MYSKQILTRAAPGAVARVSARRKRPHWGLPGARRKSRMVRWQPTPDALTAWPALHRPLHATSHGGLSPHLPCSLSCSNRGNMYSSWRQLLQAHMFRIHTLGDSKICGTKIEAGAGGIQRAGAVTGVSPDYPIAARHIALLARVRSRSRPSAVILMLSAARRRPISCLLPEAVSIRKPMKGRVSPP